MKAGKEGWGGQGAILNEVAWLASLRREEMSLRKGGGREGKVLTQDGDESIQGTARSVWLELVKW